MSRRFVCIVEGHGEVTAVPALVHRFAARLGMSVLVARPIRVRRNALLKPGELERAVELAARQARGGAVLLILDADDDCPRELGPALLARARAKRSDVSLGVVLANHEFETWLIAGAGTLELPDVMRLPEAPEGVRDAKGRLRAARHGYRETVDQEVLTRAFDMDEARCRSRSFDKCWREMERLLGAMRV